MEQWQERVMDEKKELDDRLEKLNVFIHDPSPLFLILPHEEQRRLERQFDIMTQYSEVLAERIAAW